MAGHDDLPQPYDAKALAPAKKRQRSTSPGGAEQPKKLKRPGQRSRITEAEREQIRQRAIQRDREIQAAEQATRENSQRAAVNDVVRAHYNAVPERGRDWRKTDSRIKGLRSFNNWVKSCIIQKFAPDEDHTPGALEEGRTSTGARLCVLDIGCGKGGDLGKWQQAPQPVDLYVGLDPADISIDQAKERYRQTRDRGGGRGGRGGHNRRPQSRLFEGRFHVKDCFGESIEDIEIVQQVGWNPSTVSNSHGFDVVSMMFCMHYAFESEDKARQMLRNVASSLKKGGRFIGTIPNSDFISERVEAFNKKQAAKAAKAEKLKKESKENGGTNAKEDEKEEGEEDEEEEKEEGEADETAEWGNDIYRVRFPGKTPEDGIFRPAFGWKYNFFLHEAVEEVPEYVVPWETFRFLASEHNLELQYHKSFTEIWETEKDDRTLGPLSERMGVRERGGGPLLVSPEEMEAAAFYVGFCLYRV